MRGEILLPGLAVGYLVAVGEAIAGGVDARGLVGSRFTREEGRILWQRFAPFDRLLQVDEPYLVPGFQTKEPSTYNFNEIPAMEVDEFIASWDEQAEG